MEAREPPWSEAQDKRGCWASWLHANASPALSTRNSSVSQHLTHALFILTLSTPLLMHSLRMWYQGYETVILSSRPTLKSITSQASSAFKEHSDLVNQSCSSLRLFHSFSVEYGFLRDVPTLSTSRVPHSLGTSVRSSHRPLPQSFLSLDTLSSSMCLCRSHCITSDNHRPYTSASSSPSWALGCQQDLSFSTNCQPN